MPCEDLRYRWTGEVSGTPLVDAEIVPALVIFDHGIAENVGFFSNDACLFRAESILGRAVAHHGQQEEEVAAYPSLYLHR